MPKKITHRATAAAIGLVALISTPAFGHNCVGEMHYTAEGKLQLELGRNLANRTGISLEPMRDIQVRLRRDGRPGSELTSNVVSTDENGNYKAHGCFARDTNGILAGGDPITITIQARLRSDDLKLRDANLIDSDWHTVGRFTDRDGGTNDVGVRTYNRAGNIIDGEYDTQAQIWWLYKRELERFDKRGLGIPGRVSVTFPHNAPRDPDGAYMIGRDIFLGADDGPNNTREPDTQLHEAVHLLHVEHLKGDFSPGCIADAHHQPASNWRSSRCSGFSEGLAEAGSKFLLDRHYNENLVSNAPPPVSVAQMRNPGGFWPATPLRSLDDVERTDVGWENFFRYLIQGDEWGPNGLTARAGCSATDVKFFQLIRALRDENFNMNSATIRDVLRVLERQIDGFERRDSDIYEMVADPSNTNLAAMQDRVTNEFCALTPVVRDNINTGPLTRPTVTRATRLKRP